MRVIGGQLAGRRFGAPSGRGTRPTSDRVREALSSALESRGAFGDAVVLDLFAGTGALSFEALSRGAASAVLVDRDSRAIRELRKSAESLRLGERTEAVRLDLLRDPKMVATKIPLIAKGYDLVFADAPYAEVERVPALLAALCKERRLRSGAWIVVERPASREWEWPNGLAPVADYRYGQTGISLGRHEPEKGME